MAAIGPVGKRARELHRLHHGDHPGVSCYACRMAASYLIEGRVYAIPRARRRTEAALHLTADCLPTGEHNGRIVQTIGHRGYLRSAQRVDGGSIHVSTSSGVATYPPDTSFTVWGP